MREKLFLAVFLMLVLLIGFPSSVANFSAFADDDDDNDNLKVSAKESEAYEKQKEKAEKAREKAEEQKEKLKEKYEREIKKLEEKAKKQTEPEKEKIEKELEKSDENAKRLEEKEKEKYERELEKLQEKAKRLEEEDHDDDDHVSTFGTNVDVQLSSVTETGVTLCHYPPGNRDNAHTITVGLPAAKAHMLAHGDTLGSCENIGNIDLILEELEAKFAEKQAKLEEKRAELQEKFIEHTQKLTEKFEEKQAKRTEKLLEKVNSGEYFDEFIEDEGTLREFVLSFDSLTAEPIGQPSEPSEFSGTITLVTSSSTDSRGTMKFKVAECEIGDDTSYTCEFGKARTTSRGPGGEKNGLVVIATLHDDERGFVPGIKLFVTAEEELRPLEEGDGPIPITMHSPQSHITHQWFLGGDGTLTVSNVPPEIGSLSDYEDDEDVEDVKDENDT